MKLELLSENLASALTALSRIIVTKPQVPILANILLAAHDGKLTLTASNLETSLIVTIGAKVETAGDFTVPGRTFAEIVSSLSAEKILLEVVDGSLKIKGGGAVARINGLAATEFPQISADSALKQGFVWNLNHLDLLSTLNLTCFSAAADEGRAALTGVLFKPIGKGLTLVATDGFRLSVATQDMASVSPKDGPNSVIVPARSLAELTRHLAETKPSKEAPDFKMCFSKTENQVFFDLGATQIISSLIAGNFPDYEKIIPATSNLKIITTAEELSKAVRLASIFARDSANIVKLKTEKGKLKIAANAAQVGENESAVDAEITGDQDDFAIAFNYRYLLDFLGVVSGEVALEFSGPIAPGVFKSVKNSHFLHLIMPVRVQA
ncbi:DNA polymerase III subunit beta [Candidatus Microgenomates bacterium]|nr:DNA polymerase III subunit beta [Candidatus Microgenomates bacterium]